MIKIFIKIHSNYSPIYKIVEWETDDWDILKAQVSLTYIL